MAYFPHAHKQIFVLDNYVITQSGGTDDLVQGDFGFFDPRTWRAVALQSADVADYPSLAFVMGSSHSTDKIGSHGGYRESIKSKPIDPRHVHRFYRVTGRLPVQQKVALGFDGVNEGTAPVFEKGKQHLLRIDLKGSPALRFFGRNLYHVFDASSGCLPDNCTDPCADAPKADPVFILCQLAKAIKNDPVFSKFLNASVTYDDSSGTGVQTANLETYVEVTDEAVIGNLKATLEIVVAYVDTVFGNCSFDPRDHYELEPLTVYLSMVDESGNPCSANNFSIREITAPVYPKGSGESLLRDQILFNRYRQEPYQNDPRRREIEDGDAVTHLKIDRTSIYDSYYILYSVPRSHNPSGMHNADQYLLQISVPHNADINSLVGMFQAYLDTANSGIKLENL